MSEKEVVCPISFISEKEEVKTDITSSSSSEKREKKDDTIIRPTPSQSATDKMMVSYWNTNLLMIQKEQEFIYENIILQKKAEYNLQRDKNKHERMVRRELATMSAFENGNGQICIQKCLPDESIYYSKPIITATHLKAFKIEDLQEEVSVYALTWDGHGFELISSDIKDFIKMLDKLGVPILVGRDRKMVVAELLLSYLVSKAENIKLPRYKGWNKTSKGWHFVHDDEMTIDGICKEDKHV